MYDPNYAKVILLDLPCAVHGFVVSDGFDFYTIVLNSRLSYEMQRQAYMHEVSHIENGDISRMQDINRDLMEDCGAAALMPLKKEKGAIPFPFLFKTSVFS